MILVTGASGQFGQAVLRHLTQALAVPPNQIVAASRDPKKLNEWSKLGVVARALDFDDASTFEPALKDVSRALLISTDALDRPGRRLSQHQSAINAFARAGVQHVIYTSMPNAESSPILFAPDHAGTEQALAASTLPGWTVLRNHWYFENLAHALPSVFASGKWYSADEGGASADIARDDLALAAATVLAGTQTGKHTYTLSGAQALTRVQIAGRLQAVLGKSIEVVPVPLQALIDGAVAAGLPEPVSRIFASFDTNTAAGLVANVTDDFKRITGKSPQTFDAWLTENKAKLAAL